MSEVLIGIDLGTHILKAAAFDAATGSMLSSQSIRLPVEVGDDGRRETPMEAVDAALDAAFAGLQGAIGARSRDVAGIGMATQGGSTIVCDRATGEALTPMALWNDARCYPLHAEVTAERPVEYWRGFSLRDEPGMGLSRLRWLRATRPDLLTAGRIYGGVGEYAVHQLTGQWLQDACNAAQIGIYDARRDALTNDPLFGTGVDLTFFADLRRGHEMTPLSSTAAARFGLPAGIPVAGPYNDHEGGFASVLGAAERPMLCSLGTAWVGTFVLPEHRAGKSVFGFLLPSPTDSGVMALQPLLTGNVTWDWALAQFGSGADDYGAEVFAERVLPPDGMVALPWLNRPNPLRPEAIGGGAIAGIGPTTTRADMLRAVAAGMCCEFARVFDKVRSGDALDAVVLAGGAAKGRHFQQLMAALFHPLVVRRVSEEDWMGARGSLYAFGGPASVIGVEPITADALDPAAVRAMYEAYVDLFQRICGGVPAGAALGIE